MEPTKHSEPRRFYGRPADRSLQAYKDFVLGMTLALNPAAKDDMTEEQWWESWQAFWGAGSEAVGSDQQ
jgi:hypothetical protein